MTIEAIVHRLPAPVLRRLRFLRDQIAIRSYRPRIVEHVYGGIRLRVKVGDKQQVSGCALPIRAFFEVMRQRRITSPIIRVHADPAWAEHFAVADFEETAFKFVSHGLTPF